MDCKQVRSLADSYLSEQLLVETNHAIVAHLQRCPACRAEIGDLRRLRSATRSAVEGAPELRMRPEFGRQLRAELRSVAAGPGSPSRMRRWMPLAAGLVLVAGGLAATALLSPDMVERLAHAAAGDHQDCALKFQLDEIPITLEAAGQRFEPGFGRLALVEPAQSVLGDEPLRVAERHACVFEGRPFAHVVLTYKGVATSVLVAQRGTGGEWWRRSALRTLASDRGFHIAAFNAADHAVYVVSTLPLADVQAIARTMMQPVASAMAGA